ncbi:MAG: nuclear transport factor 2 family protein [Candidatus Sericytochromatia bacterium]
MTTSALDPLSPLQVYKRMQEAVLQGKGSEATLLPAHLLSPDLVVETPFAPAGMRRYDGREAWLSYYRTAGAGLLVKFEGFQELATHPTPDPEVLVVEYALSGRVIATGLQASVQCIAVLRVRAGLIVHWREYQDIPAITAALQHQGTVL